MTNAKAPLSPVELLARTIRELEEDYNGLLREVDYSLVTAATNRLNGASFVAKDYEDRAQRFAEHAAYVAHRIVIMRAEYEERLRLQRETKEDEHAECEVDRP